MKKPVKVDEKMKEEIREFYKSKAMTIDAVCDKFNICNPVASRILKDIPKYNKSQIFSPDLDENFFNVIDTEQKAYYLGLIIADGNIFDFKDSGRQKMLSISLQEQDKYLLEHFSSLLHSSRKVSHDGRGCSEFAVVSNKMASDLSKYGVIENKSLISYLPTNIPEHLMHHLIRGIFDGDGCIYTKYKDYDSDKNRHTFSFCGAYQLMTDLSEYCFTHIGLNRHPKVYTYKNRPLSEFKIANTHDFIEFGNWIYKNATIFMKRKKDKWDKYNQLF